MSFDIHPTGIDGEFRKNQRIVENAEEYLVQIQWWSKENAIYMSLEYFKSTGHFICCRKEAERRMFIESYNGNQEWRITELGNAAIEYWRKNSERLFPVAPTNPWKV